MAAMIDDSGPEVESHEEEGHIPMATLEPAAVLAARASRPYPNDSDEYRAARTALLTEEIELRRHIERVAAQRRTLPPGGAVPEDYVFTGEDGRKVTLSQLFGT